MQKRAARWQGRSGVEADPRLKEDTGGGPEHSNSNGESFGKPALDRKTEEAGLVFLRKEKWRETERQKSSI